MLSCSLASSKGTVPLSAPRGIPAVGKAVDASQQRHLPYFTLFRAGLPQAVSWFEK